MDGFTFKIITEAQVHSQQVFFYPPPNPNTLPTTNNNHLKNKNHMEANNTRTAEEEIAFKYFGRFATMGNKDKFINMLKEYAASQLKAAAAPQEQGEDWKYKPFSVDLLWNNEFPVGEDAKKWMGDSYDEYVRNFKEKEDAVLFSNTYVSYDSCDCGDGYGCSHGSWPFEIIFSNNDEKFKGEFEDEKSIYLNGPKNQIRIEDYTKINMGEFSFFCEFVGIKLEVKPPLPTPPTGKE